MKLYTIMYFNRSGGKTELIMLSQYYFRTITAAAAYLERSGYHAIQGSNLCSWGSFGKGYAEIKALEDFGE